MMFVPRRHDGSEKAPVMHRGTEPVQRLQMFRHAIALVGLKAITRTILGELAHQSVTRDLGDDRRRRDREHESIAADHGIATASGIEPVASVDEHVLRHFRQRVHRALQRP